MKRVQEHSSPVNIMMPFVRGPPCTPAQATRCAGTPPDNDPLARYDTPLGLWPTLLKQHAAMAAIRATDAVQVGAASTVACAHTHIHAHALMRETSDQAAWDLVGIAIVVKSRHFVECRDFPPLWGSALGPIPPDPAFRA